MTINISLHANEGEDAREMRSALFRVPRDIKRFDATKCFFAVVGVRKVAVTKRPSMIGYRKILRSSSYLRIGLTPSAIQISTAALAIIPALLLTQAAPKGWA